MFLHRLETARHHHKWVPAWDFDAVQEDASNPLRDTSAGVIAANGMLLIHQALQSIAKIASDRDFLAAALSIVEETLDLSLDQDFASLVSRRPGVTSTSEFLQVSIKPSGFDAILRNATANNNEHAHLKYWNHGLVYADYYLLEFGNKLCRMGLC